jgi:hypothetical protein
LLTPGLPAREVIPNRPVRPETIIPAFRGHTNEINFANGAKLIDRIIG